MRNKVFFLNAAAGTSKKTGKPYYRVQTVVMMENDTLAIPYDAFVDETVYEKVKNCRPRQSISLIIGLDTYGRLCVEDIAIDKGE